MDGTYVISRDGKVYALAWLMELEGGYMDFIVSGSWLVNRIFVARDERSKGYGSQILDLICSDADKAKVPLVLSIEPDGDGNGLGWDELADFYARRGFAYVIDGDPMMRRIPQ